AERGEPVGHVPQARAHRDMAGGGAPPPAGHGGGGGSLPGPGAEPSPGRARGLCGGLQPLHAAGKKPPPPVPPPPPPAPRRTRPPPAASAATGRGHLPACALSAAPSPRSASNGG